MTLLLLIAITLDAWLVSSPWVWILLALLLVGFFGLAYRIRALEGERSIR